MASEIEKVTGQNFDGIPIPLGQIQLDEGNILIGGINPALRVLFNLNENIGNQVPLIQLLAQDRRIEQASIDEILSVHTQVLTPDQNKTQEEHSIVYELDGRFILETIYPNGLIGFREFNSEMRSLRESVESRKDELTQLDGRAKFDAELSRCLESGQDYAVIFIDVDHMKNLNDLYSHSIGDAKLIEVGQVLRGCIRSGSREINKEIFESQQQRGFYPNTTFIKLNIALSEEQRQSLERENGDVVSLEGLGTSSGSSVRWGGDEFIVFLKGVSKDQLQAVIERMQKALGKIVYGPPADESRLIVSVGGVHSSDINSKDKQEIVDIADSRMYRMKIEHHIEKARQVILESGGDENILNKKMQEFDQMIDIALKAYDKSTDLSRRDILNIVEFIILAHLNHYSNIEESTSIAEIDVEQMLKNEDNRLDVGLLIARVSSMIGANMQMVHEIHHELNRFIKKEIEWSSLSTATKLAYIIRRYPILGFTQSTHEEIIARLEKELGNDPVFDLLKGILNN